MKLPLAVATALVLAAAPIGAKAQDSQGTSVDFDYSGTILSQINQSNCPEGTSEYQHTALFGLIKGRKMCLTDYEAESLRVQRNQALQQSLQNINNNRPRYCYGNRFGNIVYTSCY